MRNIDQNENKDRICTITTHFNQKGEKVTAEDWLRAMNLFHYASVQFAQDCEWQRLRRAIQTATTVALEGMRTKDPTKPLRYQPADGPDIVRLSVTDYTLFAAACGVMIAHTNTPDLRQALTPDTAMLFCLLRACGAY